MIISKTNSNSAITKDTHRILVTPSREIDVDMSVTHRTTNTIDDSIDITDTNNVVKVAPFSLIPLLGVGECFRASLSIAEYPIRRVT